MNSPSLAIGFLLLLGLLNACQTQKPAASQLPAMSSPIWQSDAYTLYRDRVVQGKHEARALSATEPGVQLPEPGQRVSEPAGGVQV
ncbi:hypothetical protein ACFQT0_22220 [Hymenobacter humi]|uniref:Lipoprotein n=1 Tax=Hymenobacter humi TaxID=1411620 RepID=A0ABW2U8E4_9BACT